MDTIIQRLFVRVHSRYTRSPHLADLSAFVSWLNGQGYHPHYTRQLVFLVMRALDASPVVPGSTWRTDDLGRAFRRTRRAREYHQAGRAFRRFLGSVGRLTPSGLVYPHERLIETYRHHLSAVRGLATDSIVTHLWEVGAFLRYALPHGEPVTSLSADVIERYIQHRSPTVARRSLAQTVNNLRVFLRYCFEHQLVSTRLDVIERPMGFRYELPPRALKWSLIQGLLRSIDRDERTGWRDFMILHLMAHYGLRNGEVTRLTMESIDWSEGTVLVEQSKTNTWLKLPLLKRTLRLLGQYLRKPRPVVRHHRLFQHGRAPFGPMTKTDISQMFKCRARQSGLPIAHASAYSLRHSFAMRLFAQGVGIKAIGDLMGHGSIESTSIYLRLQTDMLRTVALPVPTKSMEDAK
jgi:integrase/recombinase XerD